MSVSSEGSIPQADDYVEAVEPPPDQLLGSQSRSWLSDIAGQMSEPDGNTKTMGQDGLFVDYHFPLGDFETQNAVKWKRPKWYKEMCLRHFDFRLRTFKNMFLRNLDPLAEPEELCSFPQFIVDGATRMDVRQGKLSDCWFLSALSSLSLNRPLLQRVIPSAQGFQDGYDGSFCFRFWQCGQWEEVMVDDLLPTQEDGQLLYLSSPEKYEFWSCLLEKAYAKLKGGYRALDMGFPHEAMVDMTGGVAEVLAVASLSKDLPAFLQHLLAKGALINCANCQGPLEQMNDFGIVFRHAYSLTGVEKVMTTRGPVDLVRLHNPWGNTEWKGPWSDLRGPEWNTVSKIEQTRLGRVNKDDGEFWMSVSDFRQNLDVIELCHMSDTLSQSGVKRPWHCTMHHGRWVPRFSAGGPPNLGWFWQNPQFHLTLLEEDDDPTDSDKACSFLVSLMQKHERRTGVHLAIRLDIYKARYPGKPLSRQDLSTLPPVLIHPTYVPRREVVLRGRLAPGHYVIVASTSQPNQEGAFLLRVMTEKGNSAFPADRPGTAEISSLSESPFPHLMALPSPNSTRRLFKKHCNKGLCKPLELHRLLTDAIQGGVLAGSEKKLVLEHCKSMVVLMDSQGLAQLDWQEFQNLWHKICRWTDIFLKCDKNKSKQLEYREVIPALKLAGFTVDDFMMQMIGLRYTEPDMTISYPGFLYFVMKLDSMIQKFYGYDMAGLGSISVSFKQWLHMTMYN